MFELPCSRSAVAVADCRHGGGRRLQRTTRLFGGRRTTRVFCWGANDLAHGRNAQQAHRSLRFTSHRIQKTPCLRRPRELAVAARPDDHEAARRPKRAR
jgi:hypothetical protein